MDTKALRQKILDLAIRGKLVPQDPTDEPASVLLERIRAEKQQMVKDGKLKAKDIKGDSVIFKGEDNLHYEKMSDGTVKCIEEEIPFDVPDGWTWTRLCTLGTFAGGKTPSTAHREYWDGDVLWVTSKDMKTKYIADTLLKMSDEGAKQMQLFPPDSLLMVVRSGILRRTFPLAILKTSATVNQDIKVSTLYYPSMAEYTYVFLKASESGILTHCSKSGTTVESINVEDIKNLLIAIPPVNEQYLIADAVSLAFEQIEVIESQKSDLTSIIAQAKTKILDLAIRGKLVPQDPTDEPASALLDRIRAEKEEMIKAGKIKRDKNESYIFRGDDKSYYEKVGNHTTCIDAELPFDIPEGWMWVRLGNIGKWQSGATPSRRNSEYYNGNIAWLKTGDLNDSYITNIPEMITKQALSDTSAKINPIGSVLIAMYGATIGKMGILSVEAATNQACCACSCFPGVENIYLFYYLLSQRADFIAKGAGGAQPNISKEKIVSTLMPLPPQKEQEKICRAIDLSLSHLSTIVDNLNQGC